MPEPQDLLEPPVTLEHLEPPEKTEMLDVPEAPEPQEGVERMELQEWPVFQELKENVDWTVSLPLSVLVPREMLVEMGHQELLEKEEQPDVTELTERGVPPD